MMKIPGQPICTAIAAALCLAGLTGTAAAGETTFRTIDHAGVAGYRSGHHARACLPGQHRAHGTCYADAHRRDDRYNADYRHRDRYSRAPHRGYLHRFGQAHVYVPYRPGRRHDHGDWRPDYRWGIHLNYRDRYRHRR